MWQEDSSRLIAQMTADETLSRGVLEELKSKVKSSQAFLEQKERLEASMKQLQDSLNTERSEFARKFRWACLLSWACNGLTMSVWPEIWTGLPSS